jgi:hypothetical protein
MSRAPAPKAWTVSAPVPPTSLTSLLFVVVIVGCVYVGREVLVPMALAVLLSFALAPSTSAGSSAVLKPTDRPIPVEVRQPDAGALQTLQL